MSDPNDDRSREIGTYAIGYALALILSGAAFAAVHWQIFGPRWVFATVLALAWVQMVVHFRFFLHITLAKSARDDLQLILFSTLIVLLMVGGTIVILFNLRDRMI